MPGLMRESWPEEAIILIGDFWGLVATSPPLRPGSVRCYPCARPDMVAVLVTATGAGGFAEDELGFGAADADFLKGELAFALSVTDGC